MRSRSSILSFPIVVLTMLSLLALSGCGTEQPQAQPTQVSTPSKEPLIISAIPDQDPEKLQRLYGTVATYLSKELGIPVEYKTSR